MYKGKKVIYCLLFITIFGPVMGVFGETNDDASGPAAIEELPGREIELLEKVIENLRAKTEQIKKESGGGSLENISLSEGAIEELSRLRQMNADKEKMLDKNKETIVSLTSKNIDLEKDREILEKERECLRKSLGDSCAQLGAFYAQHKLYREALGAYEKSLQYSPDNYNVYYQLGLFYAYIDVNSDKAVSYMEKSLEFAKSDEEKEKVEELIKLLKE